MIPTELERRIEHAVSWVLNPLSHSQTVDRYRTEIEDAIYAVDELNTFIKEALTLRSVHPIVLMQMLSSLLKARIAVLQASKTT